MHTIIKHSLTCKDNETYDIGRILWAFSVLSFNVLGVYSVFKGQPWSASEFGVGLSALLAGGGFSVAVKSKTEPKGEQHNDKQP